MGYINFHIKSLPNIFYFVYSSTDILLRNAFYHSMRLIAVKRKLALLAKEPVTRISKLRLK